MKFKHIFALTALMIFTFLLSAVSYADIPAKIDSVEIDDIIIKEEIVNRLSFERDNEYEVEIQLIPEEDLDDVEIEVFISGYEFSDFERQGFVIPTFDADKGVKYVKRAKIEFSEDVEEDDYRLRIIISDRDHSAKILEYRIKIDVPRHGLQIEDVSFFPGTKVTAGSALLTTVRLENKGEKDEDDIKVTVSIPELGLSGVDFIEEIEYDDEEETEEIFLSIPKCADSGLYLLQAEIDFNEGREKFARAYTIEVLENEACREAEEKSQVEVVVTQPPVAPTQAIKEPSIARTVLEIILLILVGLLVIVGIIVGFTKLRREEEF